MSKEPVPILRIIAVIWLACWIGTWGALTAWYQADFPDASASRYRGDLAFSCGISILPPTWVVAPFVTGFYEHGWCLTREGCGKVKPRV